MVGVLVHKLQNQFPQCVHVSVYLAAPKTLGKKGKQKKEKKEKNEKEEERKKGVNLAIL